MIKSNSKSAWTLRAMQHGDRQDAAIMLQLMHIPARVLMTDNPSIVIHIHKNGDTAHFERNGEAIGKLWFNKLSAASSQQWELTDYDGVFALPRSILKALRMANYRVDESFE